MKENIITNEYLAVLANLIKLEQAVEKICEEQNSAEQKSFAKI